MKTRMPMLLGFVILFLSFEAHALPGDVPNCDCITADSCFVICPGGDIPFNVFLYSDEACQVPIVGFDCIRIDFGDSEGITPCSEAEPDWPYVYPNGPSDGDGRVEFTPRLLGCSPESPVYLQVCGCQDRELPCVKSLDLDGDGWVTDTDIAYCDSLMGSGVCCCDFDCDGIVDGDDLDLITAHRLHSCTQAPPPCTPVLLTPSNGIECLAGEVVLDWTTVTGALGYEVQIGTGCGAGTTYAAAGTEKALSGLAMGTTYYWRARAECPAGWGPWTYCWTFVTTPFELIPPTLTFPAAGESDVPTDVTLEWDCVPGAESYDVRIGASCFAGTEYSVSSCYQTVSGLDPDTQYWWSVRAEGGGCLTDWSECRCFTTAPPGPPPPCRASAASWRRNRVWILSSLSYRIRNTACSGSWPAITSQAKALSRSR